MSLPD